MGSIITEPARTVRRERAIGLRASTRIPFNRIPEAGSESEADGNALWLQSLNRFKAQAEQNHRRRERKPRGE
jgi:hypothetical protein